MIYIIKLSLMEKNIMKITHYVRLILSLMSYLCNFVVSCNLFNLSYLAGVSTNTNWPFLERVIIFAMFFCNWIFLKYFIWPLVPSFLTAYPQLIADRFFASRSLVSFESISTGSKTLLIASTFSHSLMKVTMCASFRLFSWQ